MAVFLFLSSLIMANVIFFPTLLCVFCYSLASASCLLKTCCLQNMNSHKAKAFWFGDDVLETLRWCTFVSLTVPMRFGGTHRKKKTYRLKKNSALDEVYKLRSGTRQVLFESSPVFRTLWIPT